MEVVATAKWVHTTARKARLVTHMVEGHRQAVALLSEGDQEILLMRTFEGMSNQEIGYVLDIDPAAASKRYGRAMLRLSKVFEEIGLTDSMR